MGLVKFTWPKDPAGAPVPGIYAVVDYVSHSQSMDIECGYLAWYEEADGSFLLIHQQMDFLSKTLEKKMTPQAIATVKNQLGGLADRPVTPAACGPWGVGARTKA